MEATDGFDNRSTGFLALKCGKVILTARLHYLLEGSPKVRVELTQGHPYRFLSLVRPILVRVSSYLLMYRVGSSVTRYRLANAEFPLNGTVLHGSN